MAIFSSSRRPKMQLLSSDQVERIHLASMKLLEDVGVLINNDKALKLLRENGVDVDFNRKIARIPQHMVKESLVKVPSSIRLHSRMGRMIEF